MAVLWQRNLRRAALWTPFSVPWDKVYSVRKGKMC